MSKADLLGDEAGRYGDEFAAATGLRRERILAISGVTGAGVPDLLDRLLSLLPAPVDPNATDDYNPLRDATNAKSKV